MIDLSSFRGGPQAGLNAYQLMFQQYLRFVVTGAIAISAYLILLEVFRISTPLPLWGATGAAYLLASGLNYWLNFNWAFAPQQSQTGQQSHAGAAVKYTAIAVLGVSLNAVTVPVLVRDGLSPLVAGFAFAITWPIFSFFAQKYWAFKEVD